jgi:hypothetical protein
MSSTKQRQELSKIKKQQIKAQQALCLRSNKPNYLDPIWARVGLFDVVPEVEQLANGHRLQKNKNPVEYGNHFMAWENIDNLFAGFQEETVIKDGLGRITGMTYRNDNINWTPHAIERLWQRDGLGIKVQNYQPNLGIGALKEYLSLVHPSAKSSLIEQGQVAVRTDLIVPCRGGALLGSIRLGESSVSYKGVEVKFGKLEHKFCAHTWISEEQLRPEQWQICDAILNNQMELAAELMNKNHFRLEAIDIDAFQGFMKDKLSVNRARVQELI